MGRCNLLHSLQHSLDLHLTNYNNLISKWVSAPSWKIVTSISVLHHDLQGQDRRPLSSCGNANDMVVILWCIGANDRFCIWACSRPSQFLPLNLLHCSGESNRDFIDIISVVWIWAGSSTRAVALHGRLWANPVLNVVLSCLFPANCKVITWYASSNESIETECESADSEVGAWPLGASVNCPIVIGWLDLSKCTNSFVLEDADKHGNGLRREAEFMDVCGRVVLSVRIPKSEPSRRNYKCLSDKLFERNRSWMGKILKISLGKLVHIRWAGVQKFHWNPLINRQSIEELGVASFYDWRIHPCFPAAQWQLVRRFRASALSL